MAVDNPYLAEFEKLSGRFHAQRHAGEYLEEKAGAEYLECRERLVRRL